MFQIEDLISWNFQNLPIQDQVSSLTGPTAADRKTWKSRVVEKIKYDRQILENDAAQQS